MRIISLARSASAKLALLGSTLRPSNLFKKVTASLNDFIGLFSDSDFSTEGCDQIPSIILEEARTFVTFMSSMVEELIGNEQVMMAIARAQGKEYRPTLDQWAKDNGIEMTPDEEDEEDVSSSNPEEDDEDSDYRRY